MSTEQVLVALRARRAPLAIAPLVVIAGLGSRALLSGLPAKIAGDALYTVLVHVVVLAVRPDTRPRRAAAIALGFSFAIELFQITPYPAWLSSKHVILRLIFGTTFGFVDLFGYVVGAAISFVIHASITSSLTKRRA